MVDPITAASVITSGLNLLSGSKKNKPPPKSAADLALDDYTRSILRQVDRSQAFAPAKTLGEMSPDEVRGALSFMPQGSGIGGFNVGYGGVEGQRYANYQTPSAPGQQLAMFGMAPGQPLPSVGGGTGVGGAISGGIGALQPPPTSELSPFLQEKADDIVAMSREDQGLPEIGSYEDQVPKPDPRDYGAKSVSKSGSIYWGPGHGGGARRRMKAKYAEDLADWERAKERYEALYNDPNEVQTARYGGIMTLAGGGFSEEDFQRMNGPISGPGTETSDDIPAMLSDGEFVVNAKAVRGIGKLGGADQSKEDQRREGARMMYALQRAGEQAMKRASS